MNQLEVDSYPSRLTEEQKKCICSLLGNVQLHLLYKASLHGYTASNFHRICDNQGPTLIVAYSTSREIIGGYTSKAYTSASQYINDEDAFLFSLEEDTIPVQVKITTPNGNKARLDGAHQGPCFGNEVFFLQGGHAKVSCQPGNVYSFTNNIYSDPYTYKPFYSSDVDYNLTECEVFRVTEASAIKPGVSGSVQKPWRNVLWTAERKEELMESIKSYKPVISSVSRIRVLLIGPVGAGKSSFFNSINSVFRGHVTSQATSGSSGTSVTTQFRTYTVKDGRGGNALPLVLCDTMGMEESTGAGLNTNDISSIIKGCIPDRYNFNPVAPFQQDDRVPLKPVTLQDKVHCVAYVLDAAKVNIISGKVEEKLAAIRRVVSSLGIPQIVLLTKVDEACPIVEKDLQKIYLSDHIKTTVRRFVGGLEHQFQKTSNCVGVPVSNIMPVKNYSHEVDLDLNCDILLLTAVQQMLRFADNYFDDISPV